MKKKSFKSLKLNKKSISTLQTNSITGGDTSNAMSCVNYTKEAGTCPPPSTNPMCPTFYSCPVVSVDIRCFKPGDAGIH